MAREVTRILHTFQLECVELPIVDVHAVGPQRHMLVLFFFGGGSVAQDRYGYAKTAHEVIACLDAAS